MLAEVGEAATPYAAYAWYCAGEAELARRRRAGPGPFGRALELAELTNASFVAGVAGASKASIDARLGDPFAAAEDYRRLIAHWRRAGMWSTQWTMLRVDRRTAGPARAPAGRRRCWSGAVRATRAGHRIFGHDEAALAALATELRARSVTRPTTAALAEGAVLDGDAAVELALQALSRGRVVRALTSGHHRGCSARIPSTDLPTISWVMASLPGWKPPQRTSR